MAVAMLVVALSVVQLLDGEFGLDFVSLQLKQFVSIISTTAYGFLILAVVHQDAVASLRHDGLTRPIPRRNLLMAKGVFIVTTIFMPVVVGDFVASLVNGGSLTESIAVAISVEHSILIYFVLLVAAIAAVTSTLLEAASAGIGVFVVLLVLERWSTKLATTGEEIFFRGSGWVLLKPLAVLALALVALVLWLQYARRETTRARIALGLSLLLVMTLPAFFNWERVFAVQKSLSVDPAAANSFKLTLVTNCIPSGVNSTPRPTSLEELLEIRRLQAGSDAITLSTAVVHEGLPVDWKVFVGRVIATFKNSNNETLQTLRPVYFGSIGQPTYWILPRDAYSQLQSQSARLQLDYSVSLLQPHSYEIPIGSRQHFPDLGYCGAKLDRTTGEVSVDCFKHGAQPAWISGEFSGEPTSSVIARAPDFVGGITFAPAWLAFLGGERYSIKLRRAAQTNASRVKVTAYEPRAHVDRHVVVPGVVGGPINICPAPSAE